MRLLFISLGLTFLSAVFTTTQAQNRCGTVSYMAELIKQHPEIRRARMKMEEQTDAFENENPKPKSLPIVEIPVVVHILTPSIGAPENIIKEQVYRQMIILNAEFSRVVTSYDQAFPPFWAGAYSGDTRIRFCLAQLDPDDQPTSGITRTPTTVDEFDRYLNDIKFDAMGGKDAWPTKRYLNIWVGDVAEVLGYAQYPGGPVETDGVVVDYTAFGDIGSAEAPYDGGRTLVHEIGHWLNLFHPWGEEGMPYTGDPACATDDDVQDTPPQEAPNFGCGPYTFSCDGSRDMLGNFMNYVDDACMNFFSRGQARRMRAQLAPGGFHYPLTQSDRGCRKIVWRRDDE